MPKLSKCNAVRKVIAKIKGCNLFAWQCTKYNKSNKHILFTNKRWNQSLLGDPSLAVPSFPICLSYNTQFYPSNSHLFPCPLPSHLPSPSRPALSAPFPFSSYLISQLDPTQAKTPVFGGFAPLTPTMGSSPRSRWGNCVPRPPSGLHPPPKKTSVPGASTEQSPDC